MEDVEAWLIGMKNLFEMHHYINNMKVRIAIFSVKGKVDIRWEYAKCVKDIRIEELSWHEFGRIFNKNYLSKVL